MSTPTPGVASRIYDCRPLPLAINSDQSLVVLGGESIYDKSADKFVVFAMGANPKPVDTARDREPKRPEIETDSDAVKFSAVDRLEMQ